MNVLILNPPRPPFAKGGYRCDPPDKNCAFGDDESRRDSFSMNSTHLPLLAALSLAPFLVPLLFAGERKDSRGGDRVVRLDEIKKKKEEDVYKRNLDRYLDGMAEEYRRIVPIFLAGMDMGINFLDIILLPDMMKLVRFTTEIEDKDSYLRFLLMGTKAHEDVFERVKERVAEWERRAEKFIEQKNETGRIILAQFIKTVNDAGGYGFIRLANYFREVTVNDRPYLAEALGLTSSQFTAIMDVKKFTERNPLFENVLADAGLPMERIIDGAGYYSFLRNSDPKPKLDDRRLLAFRVLVNAHWFESAIGDGALIPLGEFMDSAMERIDFDRVPDVALKILTPTKEGTFIELAHAFGLWPDEIKHPITDRMISGRFGAPVIYPETAEKIEADCIEAFGTEEVGRKEAQKIIGKFAAIPSSARRLIADIYAPSGENRYISRQDVRVLFRETTPWQRAVFLGWLVGRTPPEPEGGGGGKVKKAVIDFPKAGFSVRKTSSATDPLTLYMAKVTAIPPMSQEEVLVLLERYKQGDSAAGKKIVEGFQRLVISIARKFYNNRHSLLDLIQEGNVGLLRALERYDPKKGTKFSTYAYDRIRDIVKAYTIKQYSLFRIATTNKRKSLIFSIPKAIGELEHEGVEPNDRALAIKLDVSEEEIRDMRERLYMASIISLDRPAGEFVPNGCIPTEDLMIFKVGDALLGRLIEGFANTLDERNRAILLERLFAEAGVKPATLEVLSERFGVTGESIRQREENLKIELRRFTRRHGHELIEDILSKVNALSAKEQLDRLARTAAKAQKMREKRREKRKP